MNPGFGNAHIPWILQITLHEPFSSHVHGPFAQHQLACEPPSLAASATASMPDTHRAAAICRLRTAQCYTPGTRAGPFRTPGSMSRLSCPVQMERYVYKRRNDGIYVINLEKTYEKLQMAARVIVAIENPQVLGYWGCASGHGRGR